MDRNPCRTTDAGAWLESVYSDIAALDLRSQFETEGRTRWSEADSTGKVTVHETRSHIVPAGDPAPPLSP